MTITKGKISRKEALQLAPAYVAFIEDSDWNAYDAIERVFPKLRRGQSVITHIDGVYVKAKVSSVNHNDYRAIDGPVVRVSNGEYSWRVDGDHYAWPI